MVCPQPHPVLVLVVVLCLSLFPMEARPAKSSVCVPPVFCVVIFSIYCRTVPQFLADCACQSSPGCGVSVLVVLRHQRKPGPGVVRLTLLWPGSSLESGVPVGREPSNRHHQYSSTDTAATAVTASTDTAVCHVD